MKTQIIPSNWMLEADLRLDAEYHLSDGRKTRKLVEQSPFKVEVLDKYSSRIFYGGRSSRKYVSKKDKGIPFIGSKDMLKADISPRKYISKKETIDIAAYLLETNWILISRSGNVGNTVFTNTDFLHKGASEHIIRVVPNGKIEAGYLYAFLSSKFGYALMTQGTFGAVIRHIEPNFLSQIPIPLFPAPLRSKINNLIMDSARKKEEATKYLNDANEKLFEFTKLKQLTNEDFDFFAHHDNKRTISTFAIPSDEINCLTLNAFNHSNRMRKLTEYTKNSHKTISLESCLDQAKFFSTGSFPRLELNSPKSIRLINQTDIFSTKIKGKNIARKNVRVDNLVKYGEILIAAVGTLGENETFGRVIFANEELTEQLVSGEFIRMKTSSEIPSGYLFTWLNSEYGFRMIRSTQTGTKLCRPIQKLLANIPVPILPEPKMHQIDSLVKKAHSLRWESVILEGKAINLIEKEIESWQK